MDQDTPVSGDQFQAVCVATFDYPLSLDAVGLVWTTSDLLEIRSPPPRLTFGPVQRMNSTAFYREALFDPVLTLDSGLYGCLAYARDEFLNTSNGSVIVDLNVTGEMKIQLLIY